MLFEVYKRKQGLIVRAGVLIVGFLLLAYGMYKLYYWYPIKWEWVETNWLDFTIPLVDIYVRVSPKLAISLGGMLASFILIGYLCFRHKRISEFLIDTESEMRKVSWPTPKEVVNSSLAIIVIVTLLSLYLYGVDFFFSVCFKWLFKTG